MNILYISSTWEEISMADRVAVLNEGKISFIMSPNILLQKEEILKNTGHCLPDIYKLALELSKYGLNLPENVQEVNQMTYILTKIFREKKD
jgi:hypothetical protein